MFRWRERERERDRGRQRERRRRERESCAAGADRRRLPQPLLRCHCHGCCRRSYPCLALTLLLLLVPSSLSPCLSACLADSVVRCRELHASPNPQWNQPRQQREREESCPRHVAVAHRSSSPSRHLTVRIGIVIVVVVVLSSSTSESRSASDMRASLEKKR